MMHSNRVWSVERGVTAEELADSLTSMTWCCCHGRQICDYYWLNDATSPDGAQEYAVIKHDRSTGAFHLLESITMSWCDYGQALAYIRHTLAGRDDRNEFRRRVNPRIERPVEHGSCRHCA